MKLKNKIIGLSLFAIGILTVGSVALAKGWFRPEVPVEIEQPDPNSEWEKLIKTFQEMQKGGGLNLEGQIKLFDSEKPDVLNEQNTTVMQQKGNQFYYAIAGVRYYCDGNTFLQVDPINRMVLVSKATPESSAAMQVIPQLNKSLVPGEQGFQITGTIEGGQTEKRLTIQNEQTPEIKSCTIIYDPGTYKIKGVNIEWRKDNLISGAANNKGIWETKISYTYHPVIDLNMEAEIRKIISVDKEKITLIGQEKDYTLQVIN